MTGTPTVSTSVGTDGLALTPGEHVMVAEDAEGLAEAVSQLLVDDKACERLAANGRQPVLDPPQPGRRQGRRCSGPLRTPLPRKLKRTGAIAEDPGAVPAANRLSGNAAAAGRSVRGASQGRARRVSPRRREPEGQQQPPRLDPFTAWKYPSPDLDGEGPVVDDDVDRPA